jgi:hypothetical protein
VTDSLVEVLSDGETFGFNALFLRVHQSLKLKNAVNGGEEMLRLRCYDKLQKLGSRGYVLKLNKTYKGLEGLQQATSVHQLARTDAAIAAARGDPGKEKIS